MNPSQIFLPLNLTQLSLNTKESIFYMHSSLLPNFTNQKKERKKMEFFLASKIKFLVVLLLPLLVYAQGEKGLIGVNYGTAADNLPPPLEVARFLLNSTTVERVRFFDSDPEMLRAFANTGIAVTVTVPTDQIPQLTKLDFAQQWLKTYIVPHAQSTNIVRILVGNEVLSTGNKLLLLNLVPAMRSLRAALIAEKLAGKIQISTPHSLGLLSNSTPPSAGRFREGYDVYIIKPLLAFLKETDSPFMVNPYPFFGCSGATLDYALFRPNGGTIDAGTGLIYRNMVDAQLDAVFSAMRAVGFEDVEVAIAETGWPSRGEGGQVGVDDVSAGEYNRELMRHVTSGAGTPLMPNRTFETYIFALFNEDLKPGPVCERNFGLFRPDFTPVYDVGMLKRPPPSSEAARRGACWLVVILLHSFLLEYL